VVHRPSIARREARRGAFLRRSLLAIATVCVVCAPTVAAAGQIRLAWDASSDATVIGYRVYYGTTSGVYGLSVDAGNQTSVAVNGLINGVRYYFVVRAYNTFGYISAPSNEANGLAATAIFTDDPLTPGVHISKVVHLTELRLRINALRTAIGLPATVWTDPVLTPGVTIARALHLTEMRTALTAVHVARKTTVPVFTDPVLVAGAPIRAVHINDLRTAVKALE
jgi:hypothetical protein